MINLRKYKYVVIADGKYSKQEANVIICSDIYQAQTVYKEALEDDLEPMIMEMDRYIDSSMLDRYIGEEEGLQPQTTSLDVLRELVKRTV